MFFLYVLSPRAFHQLSYIVSKILQDSETLRHKITTFEYFWYSISHRTTVFEMEYLSLAFEVTNYPRPFPFRSFTDKISFAFLMRRNLYTILHEVDKRI